MKSPLLITMSGPDARPLRVQDMSDVEAGLAFLGMVNKVYPGIRMEELPLLAARRGLETMGRSWLNRMVSHVEDGAGNLVSAVGDSLSPTKVFNTVKGEVGDVKDGIGDVLKDSFNATAGAAGDAVHLMTSQQVLNFANSSYDHLTADGGIMGAVGGSGISTFFGGGSSGSSSDQLLGWLQNLGAAAKNQGSDLPGGILPWAIGGGLVLVLLLRRHH